MMCEHEFEQFTIGKPMNMGFNSVSYRGFCVICGRSRVEAELEKKLAAAQAELAAAKESSFDAVVKYRLEHSCCPICGDSEDHRKSCALAEIVDLAVKDVQAELAAEREKREQAEAQCAAMREEIRKIIKLHQGREFSYPFVEAQKIAMDILTGQTVVLRKTALLTRLHRMEGALREIPEQILDRWVALESANKPNIRTALINYVSELAKAALEVQDK